MSSPTSPRRSTSAVQAETTAKGSTSSTQRGPARTGKTRTITTAGKASTSRPATAVRGRAARPAAGDPAAAQGRPSPARREAGVSFPMTTTAQVEHRDAIRARTQARLDALRARTA